MALSLLQHLERLIELKDAAARHWILSGLFEESLRREAVPILCRLLADDGLEEHEDIALLLQEVRDPRSADALFMAATGSFEHLVRWNNVSEFRRKCTWALADIGSERAKSLLTRLSQVDDEQLAVYARARLDNWAAEMHRKGAWTACNGRRFAVKGGFLGGLLDAVWASRAASRILSDIVSRS